MVGEEGGELSFGVGVPGPGEGVGDGGGLALAHAADDRGGDVELEGGVEPAGDVPLHLLRRGPDLADHERVRVDAAEEGAVVPEPGDRLRRVLPDGPVLDEVLDGVEAEAVGAHLLEPEAREVVHGRGRVRVAEVQVGHAGPEEGEVVGVCAVFVGGTTGGTEGITESGSGLGVVLRAPEVAGLGVARVARGPDVPVALRGVGVEGLAEPRVLRRGVVDDEVEDDADPALAAGGDEVAEVLVGAVLGVDRLVVDDVVSVIRRALHHRHEPEGGGAEVRVGRRVAVVDVVEAFDQPAEVADAVVRERALRGVGEGADEDVVDDGVPPPRAVLGPRRGARGRRGGGRPRGRGEDEGAAGSRVHGSRLRTGRASVGRRRANWCGCDADA